jgi:hypothetical protein
MPATDDCKAETVQSKVAIMNGWRDVFKILTVSKFPRRTAISLTSQLPLAILALADLVGMKKAVVLAIIGRFMAGGVKISFITFVPVADVCPPGRRCATYLHITVKRY